MSSRGSKHVEKQIQASEGRLSDILELARLGVWDWNIETGELVWSRECLEMFGLPLDTEMSYQKFLEVMHPDDRERVDQAVKTALDHHEEYSTEMRAIWPDGSLHWIASRGRGYYDKSGKPVRMTGAGVDITRFKQTEEELERARATAKAQADNLAAVLDAVPALTLVTEDREAKTMTGSRLAYELFGLTYGTNISQSAPPGERPDVVLLENGRELKPEELPVQQVAATGREVRDKELEVRFPDGRSIFVFGHAAPLFDEAGQVRGAVGAYVDLTERKRAEAELKKARAEAKAQADNLAAVFDAVPAAIFLAPDRSCEKMVSNRAAYDMLRMPYGSNTSRSAPKGERPQFIATENGKQLAPEELPVQQAARTGQPVRNKELKIQFEDGSSVYQFGHAVPLFDEAGKVRGAIGAFLDITDRKILEERLRLATERFQIALRSTPMTVFGQGKDLRYTWVYNPMRTHTAVEILGKHDSELLERQEDAAMVEAIKTAVLRTGIGYQGEMVVLVDGEPRTYYVTIEAQRDPQGHIVGLTGAAFDLTERKRLEEERANLARQLEMSLDAAKMGWWHYDPASKNTNWDDKLKVMFGLTRNSGSAEDLYRIMHPDHVPEVREKLQAAMDPADPKPYCSEYRIILPDGRLRWIEAYGKAEFEGLGANRRAVSCSGTVRDITERKRAEEELRQSHWRSRQLIESNIIPVVRANMDGITEANDAFLELIGYTREELARSELNWVKLTPPEYLSRDYDGIEQLKKRGFCAPFEKEYILKDGRRVPVLMGATAINQSPLEWQCFVVDLTQLKGAQAELEESKRNLEIRVEERTHQLEQRTAEVMRTSEGLKQLSARLLRIQDEERRRIARELHDSAGQLLTALGLELANLEHDLQKSAPNLKKQVEESQILVQQLHKEIRTTSYLLHPPLLDEAGLLSALNWYTHGLRQRSGIEIHLEMPEDFGRLPRDIELVVFRLVQESLTNIHRHSGSKTATIRLARTEDAITVEVQDEGKGMAPAQLEKIREGGSGVGIRGMRERLRQFGGDLRIDSGERGTQVSVMIPILRGSGSEQDRSGGGACGGVEVGVSG